MTLAMAQATAAGDLKALANYIQVCESTCGLSLEDMKRVCKHVLMAAEQYRRDSGEEQREVRELERMADL